ncbi:hypothetical protein [Marinobacter sp. MDS2]|uniref:hypothetical protein n=1 Tax=Marinobacter sp. MDS2 TaxID=3065961 RepID=UPI00273C16E1|nr:hypothetical protein [Marinobacter sp. MDS2]MDP4546480.1 hypothetical protein [Marinobacter sp. MDS2]
MMPRPDEQQFLQQALQGCEPAIRFCQTLFRISQTLDDLIDKDKALTDSVIISAFWQALIELPANPFYRQHELYLRPLMAAALQDWRDSVALERSGSAHNQTLAFVLRDQLTSVVVQCAYLVGGEAWMESAGPQIRAHFHEDTLSDYLNDLKEGAHS